MSKVKSTNGKVIAENRKARFNYAIEDDLEVGIVLEGSEVKSLRANGANIAESYASVEDGELWLINSYIAPYERAILGRYLFRPPLRVPPVSPSGKGCLLRRHPRVVKKRRAYFE